MLGLPLSGKTEGKGASALISFPLVSLLRKASDVIKEAGTKTNPFLTPPPHEAPPVMVKTPCYLANHLDSQPM